jgi:pimeloyl-ACP methyl ester carboxylesterase
MTSPLIPATRPVPLLYNPDGSVEAFTALSPTTFQVYAHIEVPPQRVIPVLLVPGIMGSNLCKKRNRDEKVWSPPNGAIQSAQAGGSGAFNPPAKRQLAFIPDEAEVDPSGPVALPAGVPWLNETVARDLRGWGTVHMASYGGLLGYLEYQLNRVVSQQQLQGDWISVLKDQAAAGWGAQKPQAFKPVSDEEVRRLRRVFYPVYAVGYNWLQSNEQSARFLQTRIDEIIGQWKKPYECSQVLLITHSMGGLVARRCAQWAAGKIVGIVHGVMPALGAAATYKRMRAGFESLPAAVLGWNEAEATASIANAPGPLELLPQLNYNNGKPWLQVQARNAGKGGAPYRTQMLPLKDPYAEIYEKDAKSCWYGLVNSDLIDPAHLFGGRQWAAYMKNLKRARDFHGGLGDSYHPLTHAYYGADKNNLAWSTCTWRTHAFSVGAVPDMLQGTAPDSDGTGEIALMFDKLKAVFKLDGPSSAGDDTVPADASGAAPTASPNVKQCYRMTGFTHQRAYDNDQVRQVLLHSIATLLQTTPQVTTPPT